MGFSRYSPDEKYPPLSDERRAELRAMDGLSNAARDAAPHAFQASPIWAVSGKDGGHVTRGRRGASMDPPQWGAA